MWQSIFKWARRILGVAIGLIIAAGGLIETADKIIPEYVERLGPTAFRKSVTDNLASLNERTARTEVVANEILRLVSERSGAQVNRIGFRPGGGGDREFLTFAHMRPRMIPVQVRTVSQDAEAISGKTGLFGGRKIDFRDACLPDVPGVTYGNVSIADASGAKSPFDEARRLSSADYALLGSGRDEDRTAFIERFGSGCYAAELAKDGVTRRCVVAVAVSGAGLGSGSVTVAKCTIEADY